MTTNKLASAALLGLMTAGLLAATPAFAGEHDKGACNGKNGCKGDAKAEKSECKGHGDKAGCKGEDKAKGEKAGCDGKDKSSCSGKSGCEGKDKKTEEKK
jgi:hypothetical protein